MSRLGKMPVWQKWFVTSGMMICSLTGVIYLLGHELQINRVLLGNHNVLAIHGIAAIFATLALGSILPFHLKAGLKSGRKWHSGFSQLSLLSALIISGALLYYGPEWMRDTVIDVHSVIGLLFFAIFLMHQPIRLRE
ncbi:hypothetical protein A9236_07065 [Polynucleobacter sp. QLW-P1DATA-2]|uniref:hypothetical protein n=1 Tax=unclassified Polynucleobacter TaxID=2640945 RepID=UPI0008F8C478|nr:MULTISPECIES: hypothetical protein [unclassified Polynucleobacter]OIN00938.1 hypothetical protein A9236_07065 [Polynucleobacter sp. QLW-P1DATA-2]OIN02499.1 hypothetical protein A9235_02120 [Polynucleobacter sp. MWH-Tro8-2-5-gr]